MTTKIIQIGSFLLLLGALTGCGESSDGRQPDSNASTSGEIGPLQDRIETLSRQRATPDQTVSSYFEAVDVQEQLNCYEQARGRGDPSLHPSDMSRKGDSFFHGPAMEYREKFRRDLATCLRLRDKLSLEFRDVHMDTPTHATIILNLKNETPIPATAVGDDQDRRRRSDGEEFKVQLTKLNDGWRIEQVFSHPYGSQAWTPRFSSQEYFPSFVFFPTAP
jgi:hypothetical protein